MNLNLSITPGKKYSNLLIFSISILASWISIIASYILFPAESSIISVFLTSFALLNIVNKLFDNNRQEIWNNIITPYQANKKLSISLLYIFLGVMAGYGLITLSIKQKTAILLLGRQIGNYQNISQGFSLMDIDFGSFHAVFRHNFTVLSIVLFFALLYRSGGLLLIIVWNASVWGAVFGYIAKNAISSFFLIYISVFMHLATESLGYILSAMAGLFISKASIKYFNEPEKLVRVVRACLLLLILGVSMIFISALIESNLTPYITKLISPLLK